MSKEVEVKYKDKVIGWITINNHNEAELNVIQNNIRFVDDDSRKLIEKQLKQPISISARRVGKVDDQNNVTITELLDLTIIPKNE